MKKGYTAMLALILLCIGITAVFLQHSPDEVPMHYNFQGEVDRMGSKYEMLIFPGIAVGMGIFFMIMAWAHKNSPKDEKVLQIVGVATLVFFNVLFFVLMYKAITFDPAAERAALPDIPKLTTIAIGILLAVVGTLLPQTDRNRFMGVRTKWSLSRSRVTTPSSNA